MQVIRYKTSRRYSVSVVRAPSRENAIMRAVRWYRAYMLIVGLAKLCRLDELAHRPSCFNTLNPLVESFPVPPMFAPVRIISYPSSRLTQNMKSKCPRDVPERPITPPRCLPAVPLEHSSYPSNCATLHSKSPQQERVEIKT